MVNSVDPDQTASTLFASILNLSVMIGNYLQQMTSEDNKFSDAFFLGTLTVKKIIYSLSGGPILISNTTILPVAVEYCMAPPVESCDSPS